MKLLSSQYNRRLYGEPSNAHDDAGGELVVKHSKVEVELRSIIKLINVHKNLQQTGRDCAISLEVHWLILDEN